MFGTGFHSEVLLGGATIASAAMACTMTYAALSPGSQLFGQTIIAGDNPNEVALTYDDGPNDAATAELLDVLALHNTRATFFMIGRFIRQRRDLARRVQAAGHLIGNHTETHPWLSFQSARVIREELRACNEALEDAIGAPVHYLRPPHGARRPELFRAAAEQGLKLVQWNAMGWDWQPITSERICINVEKGRHRAQRNKVGTNILLHDGHDRGMSANRDGTIQATRHLLNRFARQEVSTVTVDAWG